MWDKEATGVCLRNGRYVSRPRYWGSLTVVFVLAAGGRLSCGAAVRDKTNVWRTRPVAFATEDSRCATMCETENRFDGSSNSERYTALDKIRGDEGLPWKCGIEIDFLLGLGSKILGVEFDIFLAGGTQESLQISRVGGSVTLEYKLRKSESIVSRRFDGLWAPRTADDSAAVYTISVRLPDSSALSIDSLTLRLEACGLGTSDVMERDASVFIAADTQGSGRETESVDRPWRAWLALPMVGDVRSDGRRLAVGVEESWRPVTVLRETSGDSGVWKSNVAGAGGFGIRRLVENCSASCLQSDEQPCYNDPECEFGGLGCNALDDPLCRFCGFADFLDCNTGPTPVPVPTPPPTGSPAREPCDGWCLDSEDTPCFDDPTCQSGGIGCNAGGDFYCRFCGFELFVDCPIQPTPSPTMAPSPGVTLALTPSTTPTPTPVGVVPPSQAPQAPTPTPTPVVVALPSLAPTRAPLDAPTSQPTRAPTTRQPTGAPMTSQPTRVPTTRQPTGAPMTGQPTGVPMTRQPTGAPTTSKPTGAPTTRQPTGAPMTGQPTGVPMTRQPTGAPTMSQSTGAPTTNQLTGAPTTNQLTGAPTIIQPTGAPTTIHDVTVPTAVPTTEVSMASPTAAPTATPTAAPSTLSTVGELGQAFVRGFISAVGVPDDLVEEDGGEAIFQESICTLNSCSSGLESVIITFEGSDDTRMLLSDMPERRRRRLADFEDVLFELPVATTSGSDTDDAQTGSQQAAAMFNMMADPDALAAAAGVLAIGVDDIEFSDLTYFEGPEVDISNRFLDVINADNDDDASTWATVAVAVILIVVLALLAICAFYGLKVHSAKRLEKARMAYGSPSGKSPVSMEDTSAGDRYPDCLADMRSDKGRGRRKFNFPKEDHSAPVRIMESAVEEKVPVQSRLDRDLESYDLDPSGKGSLIRSGPGRSRGPESFRRAMGSEDGSSSIVSGKFTYTNPMRQDEGEGKGRSPTKESHDLDLAQYYDTFNDARSDLSSELPPNTTSNPLFSDEYRYLRGPSEGPATVTRHDSLSSSSSIDTSSTFGFAPRASIRSTGSGYGMMGSTGSGYSSRFSSAPFGLSPVDERVGGKGETDLASSSARSVESMERSTEGGGGGGSSLGRYDSSGSVLDEDDSMYRTASPGSVTRPVQPLMASQSPISGTASVMTSRSSSFASPTPVAAHNITMWVPGVGLQKGISSENLQAIMAAGGSEAERQAVREAVRKQRRKFARSLSQDAPLLPMAEDPVAEEMAEASSVSTGRDHEHEKGASRSRSRSFSMSPSRRRVAFSAERHSSGSGEFGSSEAKNTPAEMGLGILLASSFRSTEIFGSNRSDASGASADAAGGCRSTGSSGGTSSSRARARKAASVAPSPIVIPTKKPPSFNDEQYAKEGVATESAAVDNTEEDAAGMAPASIARLSSFNDPILEKASKSLRFTSRGRELSRKASSGSISGRRSSVDGGGSSSFDSPSRESSRSSGRVVTSGGDAKREREMMEDRETGALAPASAAAPVGNAFDVLVPKEYARKAIAAGAAAAATSGTGYGESSVGGRGGRRARGESKIGEKSPEALRGIYAASPSRSSVGNENTSDFDSEISGAGMTSNLRQLLADPSKPSGSYKRKDSEDVSVLSDESPYPFYIAGESSYSSRPSSLGTRSSNRLSIESWGGSESESANTRGKTGASVENSRMATLPGSELESADKPEHTGADVESSRMATTGELNTKEAAQVDAVGRGMLEAATLHQKMFAGGQRSLSSSHSSSSGESKRRIVIG